VCALLRQLEKFKSRLAGGARLVLSGAEFLFVKVDQIHQQPITVHHPTLSGMRMCCCSEMTRYVMKMAAGLIIYKIFCYKEKQYQ
jgi:hypothetical protein